MSQHFYHPTFTGFPGGTTSGSYTHTFDMSSAGSYNPAFVAAHGGTAAGAEAALLAGMEAGQTYLRLTRITMGEPEQLSAQAVRIATP